MPTLQGRWCPACGSAVGWHEQVCPSCGLPLESEWGAPLSAEESAHAIEEDALASWDADEEIEEKDTRTLPRIESAIPPEDDPESKVSVQEGMPHVGRLLLAGIFAIALVSGLAVSITHPWDPEAYSIKATEEADTSMAGFPGTVDELSGQDNEGTVVQVLSGDDATYAQLIEAYEKLAAYAERADHNEALFLQVAYGGDIDARTAGRRGVEALAIDVSNLVEDLSQIDVTSGLYAEDLEHLQTLGSWLRNRIDSLRAAWVADVKSADPVAEREQLEALFMTDRAEDGRNAYQVLFEDNYGAWAPQKKVAE